MKHKIVYVVLDLGGLKTDVVCVYEKRETAEMCALENTVLGHTNFRIESCLLITGDWAGNDDLQSATSSSIDG